jgi:hypothetical protein
LELGQVPLYVGWVIEPQFVAIMVTHAAGQSVVMSFHLITGQLQVFAGIIVYVV